MSPPLTAARAAAPAASRDEHRFRQLLGAAQWESLPAPVRRRFSRKLGDAQTATYVGEVAETHLTRAGRLFAQFARLFGSPLPLEPGGRTAAAVMVTEDERIRGQLWTRIYARPGTFPQVVRSAKRFDGPTGLEECVQFGVGMALRTSVEQRALVFRSSGYFVRIGRWRLPLPGWLMPGEMEVVHREERDGRFSFVLAVHHPWLGEIIRQVAFFRDTE